MVVYRYNLLVIFNIITPCGLPLSWRPEAVLALLRFPFGVWSFPTLAREASRERLH